MRSSMKARPQLIMSPPKETCVGYKIISTLNCFDEKEEGGSSWFRVAEDMESRDEIISLESCPPDVRSVHAQISFGSLFEVYHLYIRLDSYQILVAHWRKKIPYRHSVRRNVQYPLS